MSFSLSLLDPIAEASALSADEKRLEVHTLRSDSLSSTDLAYAAAIIDGEGTIGVSIRGGSLCVMVEAWNTDERLTDWLRERFGGHPPYVRSNNTFCSKPLHRWSLFGRSSLQFLLGVHPYLILKSRQAELTIELLTTCSPGTGRRHTDGQKRRLEEIHVEMRNLNRRGK